MSSSVFACMSVTSLIFAARTSLLLTLAQMLCLRLPINSAGGSMQGGSPVIDEPRALRASDSDLLAVPPSAQPLLQIAATLDRTEQSAPGSQNADTAEAKQQLAGGSRDSLPSMHESAGEVEQITAAIAPALLATAQAAPSSVADDVLQAELQALRSQNVKLQQQVEYLQGSEELGSTVSASLSWNETGPFAIGMRCMLCRWQWSGSWQKRLQARRPTLRPASLVSQHRYSPAVLQTQAWPP
jgi:hypothetical protein